MAKKKKIINLTVVKGEAPPWPIVCENMCKSVEEADIEYEELRKKGIKFTMNFNLANIGALYGKFNDIYTILLVAFSNDISWWPGGAKTTESSV